MVNSAPLISLGANAMHIAYTESDNPLVINAGITLSDADDTELANAVVHFSSGFVAGNGDVLALAAGAPATITAQYNSNQGVLLLSPTSPNTRASLADFQAALRLVTYSNSSQDPTATSVNRVIGYAITDVNSDGASGGAISGASSGARSGVVPPGRRRGRSRARSDDADAGPGGAGLAQAVAS